jgi:hypothetical protein
MLPSSKNDAEMFEAISNLKVLPPKSTTAIARVMNSSGVRSSKDSRDVKTCQTDKIESNWEISFIGVCAIPSSTLFSSNFSRKLARDSIANKAIGPASSETLTFCSWPKSSTNCSSVSF